jgi:hypothetical protein
VGANFDGGRDQSAKITFDVNVGRLNFSQVSTAAAQRARIVESEQHGRANLMTIRPGEKATGTIGILLRAIRKSAYLLLDFGEICGNPALSFRPRITER